jgi:hypothetical protein
MKFDNRTTAEVENDSIANLACIIFGATLIAVAIGLSIAAIIYF